MGEDARSDFVEDEGSIHHLHRQCDFSRINSRLAPRFYRRRQVASSLLQKTLIKPQHYGIALNDPSEMAVSAGAVGLCTYDEPILYPYFDNYESRRQTFIDFAFPRALSALVEPLAKFGFFYKKESVIVYCFTCGVPISDWELCESGDMDVYPIIQHAIFNRECSLVYPYYHDKKFHKSFLEFDVKNRTTHLRDFLKQTDALNEILYA